MGLRSRMVGALAWNDTTTVMARGRANPPAPEIANLLREVVAIQVHDLAPCRGKVLHERPLRVVTCIDFRDGPELRVRSEDEIDARAGPLERAGRAVAPLEHAFGCRRLPLRIHGQQVDEEIV